MPSQTVRKMAGASIPEGKGCPQEKPLCSQPFYSLALSYLLQPEPHTNTRRLALDRKAFYRFE